MNIGIFSGSFNPIHIGHLALANYLCEYGDLDEVWFMVTPHNPLKEENELMDDKLRLKLVPNFALPILNSICLGLLIQFIRWMR